MRKFTVQLDERCHQLLWRRGGKTWKSRLTHGRLTERFHYAFCQPWNLNEALPGFATVPGERTVSLSIPDKIAPGGQHTVTWLFDQNVPEGLVRELTAMNRKPWQYKAHPNDPAPPSRKRRKVRKPVAEESANA